MKQERNKKKVAATSLAKEAKSLGKTTKKSENFIDQPYELAPTWAGLANAEDVYRPANSEIEQGWPLSQTPPSRQRFNWILKTLSLGLNHLLANGVVLWTPAQTYDVHARVMAVDGKTYVALQASQGKDPTDDVNGGFWEAWGHTKGEVIEIVKSNAKGIGVPTGAIFYFPCLREKVNEGFLSLDGKVYKREDYPDLWKYASACGLLVADDVWNSGDRGKFSSGDDVTTFRLPDYTDRYFCHGSAQKKLSSDHLPGELVAQMLPAENVVNPLDVSKVFYRLGEGAGFAKNAFTGSGGVAALLASGSGLDQVASGVPMKTEGRGGEGAVRPNTAVLLACIKT